MAPLALLAFAAVVSSEDVCNGQSCQQEESNLLLQRTDFQQLASGMDDAKDSNHAALEESKSEGVHAKQQADFEQLASAMSGATKSNQVSLEESLAGLRSGDVPSAGEPTLKEEWKETGLDTKQAYFWHRDAAPHNIAVVFIHGIFSTPLDDQIGDQLFGTLLDWGYPVCSFDAADHGNTRFLNEFAGQPEEEVRCSKNAGYTLTPEKGLEYDKRYLEPVRRFPDVCAKRFEALLGKSNMKVVIMGHSWGGQLTMASLQKTHFGGPDTSRVIAAVTADMGLDARTFEKLLMRKGREFLIWLHSMGWIPSHLNLPTGFNYHDTELKEFDPRRRLWSPCPEVENDQIRTMTLGWGVASLEKVETILEPAAGAYSGGIPTLHEYCSEDLTIVPKFIEIAAEKQAKGSGERPICIVDVKKFGRCSHVSFPGRTTGWDEHNTPWKALEEWMKMATSSRDDPAAFGAACPFGTTSAR